VTSDWKGALIERADQRCNHVHQLGALALHVTWEKVSGLGGELEEAAVTEVCDVATHGPHRIERFPYEFDLLGRHRGTPPQCESQPS
jgi:hypothetical protein